MSQRVRRPRLILVAILLLYAGLAAWYSVTIPLGEAPDEVPHFTYVRYLARHGRLPTTEEEHEAFQPPLYYALAAGLTFWIQDEADAPFAVRTNAYYDVADPQAPKNLLLHTADEAWPYRGWALAWHLARLLSISLGAVTIVAIYGLGHVIFPGRPVIPLLMSGLAAFTPQFLFMSAVVNNDNAATAFSALVLWQVTALLHDKERRAIWKRSALLGMLLGLGLLSKASLIALVPVVGLAIVVAGYRFISRFWEKRSAVGKATDVAGLLLMTFGLAGALSAWYFFRNWSLHGDPMGWSFLLQINARREGPLTLEVLGWLFRGVFRSFWLGWIGIAFDEAIYWILGAACLVGLAGFVVWLVRRWAVLDGETRWSLGLLGLHAAITLASLLQWTATVLGTDQGRLIYPILPTVMLVLAVGWAWWTVGEVGQSERRTWGAWVLRGLVAGMLVLAILTPLRYIGPVHAPALVATEAELASAAPLNVQWDGLRLIGYRLDSNQVQPGDKLVVHLYWQGLQAIDQDLMTLIQLVDEDDRFLMYADGSPTAGRDTTDRWIPGRPLASQHRLPVPDYGQPGEYRLTISVHPFDQTNWLPAIGPHGGYLGDEFVLPEVIYLVTP